jgi:hypothetical protein
MFVRHGLAPFTSDEFVVRADVALTAYGRTLDVPAFLVRDYEAAPVFRNESPMTVKSSAASRSA